MKTEHKKKIVPTIIIAICLFLYYAVIGLLFLIAGISDYNPIVIFLAVAIPLIIGGLLLYVTLSRIEEIKGGEEDDLSKYWFHYWKRAGNSNNR